MRIKFSKKRNDTLKSLLAGFYGNLAGPKLGRYPEYSATAQNALANVYFAKDMRTKRKLKISLNSRVLRIYLRLFSEQHKRINFGKENIKDGNKKCVSCHKHLFPSSVWQIKIAKSVLVCSDL